MDVIFLFRFALLTPIIGLALTAIAGFVAHFAQLGKPSIWKLVGASCFYSIVAGLASLGITVVIVFLNSSAGSATPLAWLFFFGPISIAIGQLVAIRTWWYRKQPTETT